MNEFTSEVLPSAYNNHIDADGNEFVIYGPDDESVVVTKQDIARMYGIAYPEKRHSRSCNTTSSPPTNSDVSDIDVGDIKEIKQAWHDAQQKLMEKEAVLKTAYNIMTRNMEPNPDQHAASDMYHFVNNELTHFRTTQPLMSAEAKEVIGKFIEASSQDGIIGKCDHDRQLYGVCDRCGELIN